ncbi:unnamed protein product [Closterium sp. Yama58-4]|nr:unnamed protein product [Closterium sp. Yama58-4]
MNLVERALSFPRLTSSTFVSYSLATGGAGDPKVSNWWATSSKYYSKSSDGSRANVSQEVKLARVVYDQGSQGNKFDYKTPWKVVMSKIGDGKPFPYDANGIYIILTGNNVDIPGFCKKFCGWHTMNRLGGSKPVAYALVGHHGLCPASCGAKPTSPNGKPWLDAMVSTVAHEIAEAATDPDGGSGWMDTKGEENADKCSYSYGVTQTAQNANAMTRLLKYLLPALVSMLVCLSLFPLAYAGPVRVARTRQAHDEYLRQRQLSDRERKLTDIVYRGSLPPVHLVETKFSFDKERREEEQRNQGGAASSSKATPIRYHGGPVMSGETLNVYLIYYGSWPVGSGQDVIENFIQSLSLSGSDAQGEAGDPKVSNWWATSTKYYAQAQDMSSNIVSSEVNLTKVIWDKGSRGKKLGPRGPWKIVKSRIGSGKPLPYDANGIYLLLTSKDVKVAGFCTQYCGWHTMDYLALRPPPQVNLAKVIYDKGSRGRNFGENTPWEVVKSKIGDGLPFPYDANGIYLLLTSKDIKVPGFCTQYCGYHTMDYIDQDAVAYSLVGHHGKCPQNCGGKRFSPNANPAIDATISTIAHEIAEAATDPDASTGWLDTDKEENADKCSYTYGKTKTVRNKKGKNAKYNLVGLNNMKFLVQQNWDFGTDSCVSQTTG